MKIFWRVILALVAIVVLAIAYFVIFVYYKPHVNYLKAEVEIEVTGEKLYNDFIIDPLEAAKVYNGKVLLVEAVLDEIEEPEDMIVAVMILDDGFFGPEGLRFTMLKGQEAYISVGQPLQIKGFCTGFTGADVIIEHASVPQQ